MGWWARITRRGSDRVSAVPPAEGAERTTSTGASEVRDAAALADRHVVQGWLRDLGRRGEQQVFVYRSWGTVVAVKQKRHPVQVFWTDGDSTWYAAAPGAPDDQILTADQVEHVILDALTSAGPPSWPHWHHLI